MAEKKKEEKNNKEKKSILSGWADSAKHVLYGMAGHDMARYALKTRGRWSTCSS
jgi:hypothetical protein